MEYKKIGEIAIEIYSGSLPRVIDQKIGSVPVIKVGDISKLKSPFVYKCKTFLDGSKISNKRVAEAGDILMIHESGTSNLVGKTFLYLGEHKCVIGKNVCVIKHNQNPKYLLHALNSSYIQNQLKIASGKGHMPGLLRRIRIDDLKNIIIPIPNKDKQKEIADYLDSLLLSKYKLDNFLEEMLEIREKQYEYYKEMLLTGGIDRWDR